MPRPIESTGKWFINQERAAWITYRAVQKIKMVDQVIRKIERYALAFEKSNSAESR